MGHFSENLFQFCISNMGLLTSIKYWSTSMSYSLITCTKHNPVFLFTESLDTFLPDLAKS